MERQHPDHHEAFDYGSCSVQLFFFLLMILGWPLVDSLLPDLRTDAAGLSSDKVNQMVAWKEKCFPPSRDHLDSSCS